MEEKEKEITRLKHTKKITEARRMIETTKYAEVTKEYPYHQQRKLSYVRNRNNHKT